MIQETPALVLAAQITLILLKPRLWKKRSFFMRDTENCYDFYHKKFHYQLYFFMLMWLGPIRNLGHSIEFPFSIFNPGIFMPKLCHLKLLATFIFFS